jgi:putative acetyltransferase
MNVERNRPGVHIRLAIRDDVAQIASVLYESFIEYKSSYTDKGFAATTPAASQIQSRMEEGPVWVATHDGAIVGTASAVDMGEALYIRGMAILPTARGQRIGELLLNQIESFASLHGYKRLVLSTTPFLTRAIRLYEHAGFSRSVEGPHELFGTPLFTMVKSLESSQASFTRDD